MSELTVISVEKELDPIKERNLFFTIIISNFIWMVFHFTVVFFFMFQLKSVALVGIFLGIGNLFSFLLDISIGIIQKYFKAKTLFIFSYIAEITAIIIFAYFTFKVAAGGSGGSDIIGLFLSEGLNLFLLLLASFCYGLTKELQDVTLISYILNTANHDQYNSIFAKKNLGGGIGSLIGLIVSGVLLTLEPRLIIVVIFLIIILIIYFTKTFFDNAAKTLGIKDIYKFKVLANKDKITNIGTNIKEKISQSVNGIELKNMISGTKYLFLKPLTVQTGLNFKMLILQTKKEFIITYKILSWKDNSILVYWSLAIGSVFGFWDTFAATFLISFLDSLWAGGGYVLLGVIAIPAFGLQDYFGKLGNKFGVYKISNLGLSLSGVSLLLMGVFAISKNIWLLMLLAVINSIGYAACMSIAQSLFLESYNKAFANYNNLKEIDINASAAPLKLIQNLANVFGLFFGGLILAGVGYMGFFILFGGFIIYLTVWTIKNKENILKDLQ